MQFRTPLKQARGLGASHHGRAHWWAQRVSAVAMLPLMLWLVIGLAVNSGADYAQAAAWISSPINAVMLILAFGVLFYHGALGLQVALEDYVPHKGVRMGLVFGLRFVAAFLAGFAIFSVLTIALGG
ncbi:succinate dehydrogenase, hydrophobic membrane anchor protein [Spiribacter sp. C176]|uniref:Succinate dehydrogenase hydrophobic membrane anchor subunit n=1 Tax=Spiribacter salilacus TaxID=2664894 RepID=A0A6N7QQS3_9GAMM|nr:succinate dehydrogenase, hydrophobic membrane anchor protein [Spiribacter salilacus]MRH77743.1 succinate dehydrogenase, hydrophobic membrane anchor protein [Spiribacter salilacus]